MSEPQASSGTPRKKWRSANSTRTSVQPPPFGLVVVALLVGASVLFVAFEGLGLWIAGGVVALGLILRFVGR